MSPELVKRECADMVGRVPGDQVFHLAIGLSLEKHPGTSVADRAQLYDRHSPQYRHWLGVEEFTTRFGPSAQDYQAVQDFIRSGNLKVERTYANLMSGHA